MSMRLKLIGVLSTAALIAGLVGTPAHASTLTVTGDVLGVDTTYTAPGADATIGNFQTVTLAGSAQLTSGLIIPFTVIDPRGTGVGWHLQVAVADFAGTSGTALDTDPVTGGNQTYSIPANTVVMDAPLVKGTDGQSLATWTIQGGLDFTGAGIKVVSAAADQTSMGTYVVSPLPLRLTVPSNAYEGGYTSTATVTLATAP
jgi:putative surface cell wall-binding protein